MASSIIRQHFICHFCFEEFHDHSSLLSHFPVCHIKTSTKRNDDTIRLPRLDKTDRDMLRMLKLHRSNDKLHPPKNKDKSNSYLQISLSMGYLPSSKQPSFDDSNCNTSNLLLPNDNQFEQEILSNNLHNRSSYHIYKYSRREQKSFYASVKKARLKKQYVSLKKSRTNSLPFHQNKCFIILPTKITFRQRLNTNSNNSFPLLFDPNFHSLVQLSTNHLFENYFSTLNIYFQLIHSIASQEFQIIVNSNDHQHQVSYTAFSFINILRQTMTDYSINLQKTFKRNYFQTFQPHDQQLATPSKIRRCDQSISSLSSHIQIEDNHQTDNISPTNSVPIENNHPVIQPVHSDLVVIDYPQSSDRTSTEPILTSFIPITEQQNSNTSSSPIFLKKQKLEPIQNDQPSFPHISITNGSNKNKKQSSSTRKKSSNNKPDEYLLIKPIRMSTRKNSIKTEIITEVYPSFETKPVILSSSEISKHWSTNSVFYRCHACSHEEFFVVLSRECMNLHISSKHGNMEENFKQRISTFINPKGRSLKIFQHYLKWQQPWPEKQIEQIFKLSNK